MVEAKIIYGVVMTPDIRKSLEEKAIEYGIEYNEYDSEFSTLCSFFYGYGIFDFVIGTKIV